MVKNKVLGDILFITGIWCMVMSIVKTDVMFLVASGLMFIASGVYAIAEDRER